MNALTHDPEDVILRDGTTLRLRPPLAADAEAVLDFFARLSDRSRYLRFHGFPNLSPKLVESFVEPDWDERGALIGCLDGRVVALANYARLRNRRAAEVAFTVDDEHQGRGIGTRLLERLVALAADAGIEEFVAEVLPENRPDAARLPRRRLRHRARARRRRGRGSLPDRVDGALPRSRRRAQPRRGHRVAEGILRAVVRRGDRRVGAARLDRRRALPQCPRRRLHRRCLSGQPRRRARRRRPRLRVRRRHPGPGRACGDLPAGRARARRGTGSARGRRPRALRHLRGLRRDRRRGPAAPGAPGRARARARRAGRRPELPRHRVRRGPPQRDVRAARVPGREHRLLVAERRARPRGAGARRGERARPVGVRLDRQQGRRLVERPARVVGGRPGDGDRAALSRVVRQSARVRAHRAACRAHEADPRREGRNDARREQGRELAHRSARRVGGRGRRALPPGRRDPDADARRARRGRVAALRAAGAARPPRRARDERGRARDSLRRRLRGGGARAA